MTQTAASSSSALPEGHEPLNTISIQPHGMVLFLRGESCTITRVSENAEAWLNSPADELLGQSFRDQLEAESFERLRSAQDMILNAQSSSQPQEQAKDLAASTAPSQYIPLTLSSGRLLEGWVHYVGGQWAAGQWTEQWTGQWALELEAASRPEGTGRFTQQHLQQFRSQVAQLQQTATEPELLQLAATAVQQLTHVDRVMVYRFAADGSGQVVAEICQPTAAFSEVSYLGLRFPATDIPEKSRQQYAQGTFRYVPDLAAAPVGFLPPFETAAEAHCLRNTLLRTPNDCCVTYHGNMGVGAFLVIRLMQQDQLWGLMVCHHRSPVSLPVAVRLDCVWLGQILSAALAQQVSQQALVQRAQLKAYQSEFLAAISQSDDFVQSLIHPELRLLGLANAQGAAVFFEDRITRVGAAPSEAALGELYDWAITQVDESIYCTNSLPQVYPGAERDKDLASGLLFLLISSTRRYGIAWFRPEVLQTVAWAGNPADSYERDEAGELQLCPRASFAQWQETVRQTALPWQPWELESALDLRNAIVGVVLRKADELSRLNSALEQSNHELERSNQELAAFAYAASHDLKEPLRGINNYARLLLKENQEHLDEKAIARLNTLTKLTRRMGKLIDALLRFSRIGQAELHLQTIDLNLFIARVIEMQELSQPDAALEIWTPRPLPAVEADPVLLSEVYSNLLSNALKYNTSDAPWVELGYYTASEILEEPHLTPGLEAPVLYVRDNGIGIPSEQWNKVFDLFKRLHSQKKYGGGTGAGLTITQKIVERHGGKIGVFSGTEGTTFYWTLG